MKIASFSNEGEADCGVVAGDQLHLLDDHPAVGALPRPARLAYLLTVSEQERTAIGSQVLRTPGRLLSQVELLPAVPACPLYIYGHGNNPTVWARQNGQQFAKPRVPYMRVRPATALSGHAAVVDLPAEAELSGGAELGVVIGAPAYQVDLKAAGKHIAGLVLLNDLFVYGAHADFLEAEPAAAAHQNQGMHTLFKAADGAGAMGPWITTREELTSEMAQRFHPSALQRYHDADLEPWVYDRLLHTLVDAALVDESYTAAYFCGAEWLISYLSRFMKLPTGAVVGLGAGAWDGLQLPKPRANPAVSVRANGLGDLTTTLRVGRPPAVRDTLAASAPTSVWMLRGNTAEPDAGIICTQPNPLLYPPAVIGSPERTLTIPAHATTVAVSLQVAARTGPQSVYRAAQEQRAEYVGERWLILRVRDQSPVETVDDINPYEGRAGYFLGGCGPGFVVPMARLSSDGQTDWRKLECTVSAGDDLQATFAAVEYRHSLEEMLQIVSRTVTVLPGTWLCLGPTQELLVPAERRIDRLTVTRPSHPDLEAQVEDLRGAS